jgi:hypothetical protein
MAWTSPRTWVAGELVTASLFNTHIRDNESELRTGGLAIASQATHDFIYAASATQLARLAPAPGGVPLYDGVAWSITDLYPVGSIYINASVSTNPGTLLGFGTWAAFGAGRVMVGLDSGDTDFDTAQETGGAKTVTLSSAEMPSHTHTQDSHTHGFTTYSSGGTSGITVQNSTRQATPETVNLGGVTATTATNQNTGGGGAHANVQPYIVVYMWRRTA